MHDRTRRLLCRLAFLACCIAPTSTTIAWICVVRSPSHIAAGRVAWEERIAAQTGLAVSLGGVRSPARGITVFEQLVLSDPETQAQVAHIRQLEIGYHGSEFVMLASQPVVEGGQMWRLCEAFHERILRGPRAGDFRAVFHAGEVTVRQGDGQKASTLTDVLCRLNPTPTGPQGLIEFRDVALQMAEPVQLRITRNRQTTPPATHWALQTRSTALPCSLLADQVPALANLGDAATFQGTVEAVPTATGWQGEVSGRFQNVDLDRLVTERYPHKLSGAADLVFRRASFRDGKLLDAAGEVHCSGGVVSRSLLVEANQSLGLAAADRVLNVDADQNTRFRELRFGFTLAQEGLRLVGLCHATEEGVVMTDYFGPLLTDKHQEIMQVTALVRLLAPRDGEQVPATYEAYQLLHVLPLPANANTPRLGSGTRPNTSLRLRQ